MGGLFAHKAGMLIWDSLHNPKHGIHSGVPTSGLEMVCMENDKTDSEHLMAS